MYSLSHCIIIMSVWYCIMCKVYMLNVQILIIMNDVSDIVIVLGNTEEVMGGVEKGTLYPVAIPLLDPIF